MTVSNRRYIIKTTGHIRWLPSTRGLVWIAGLGLLPIALVAGGYWLVSALLPLIKGLLA